MEQVKTSIALAFQDVEEYAAVYDTFKAMFLENRQLDVAVVKRDDPHLDWFRGEMDKYKVWA